MTDTIPIMDLSNLTFRIDPKVRAEIERIAEAEDRSVAYVVRTLLNEALAARGKKKG